MEFLGKLGIDWKLLISQMINFGLLLWLLAKFLYKPIIKRIEKDEAELGLAKTGKKELDQQKSVLVQQKREKIAEAKKRSREIIREAEEIAKEIKKRAQQEAKQEKEAVIKQIRSRLNKVNHVKKSK